MRHIDYDDLSYDDIVSIYKRKLYKNFRTGFTFAQIEDILYVEFKQLSEKTNEYKWITRHTILGRWRQIKLHMFKSTYDDFYFATISLDEMYNYLKLTQKEIKALNICDTKITHSNNDFIF